MTNTQNIRRRPDGSIDTGYYCDQGRARRSQQAHEMASSIVRPSFPVVTALIVFIASLPFIGGHS
jgi:hypothetical protein